MSVRPLKCMAGVSAVTRVLAPGVSCLWRYNHHAAHRVFKDHVGMGECIIVVEAPEEQEWDTLELVTEGTAAPALAEAGQRPAAHHRHAVAHQPQGTLACEAGPLTGPEGTHAAESRGASSQKLAGHHEATTTFSKGAIFEVKDKLMARNETIIKKDGALKRAPRTPEEDALRLDMQRGLRDGESLLSDAAAERILHCPTLQASDAVHAHSSTSDLAESDSVRNADEAQQEGRDAPHSSAQATGTAQLHSSAVQQQAQPDASSQVGRSSMTGSRRLTLAAQRALSQESSHGAARKREVLFTACSSGVVLKWALDEQLQSDQYKVCRSSATLRAVVQDGQSPVCDCTLYCV